MVSSMMPNWLWSLILFAIVVPLHVLAVGPALDGTENSVRFSVAIGYLLLGYLWMYTGVRHGLVRR